MIPAVSVPAAMFQGFTDLASGTIEYIRTHPLPFSVMVGGAILGVVISLWVKRDEAQARLVEQSGKTDDDTRRHHDVVAALRALELEKDKLSPEDYAQEKRHLIEVGAGSLRALDDPGEAAPTVQVEPRGFDAAFESAWKAEAERLGADFEPMVMTRLGQPRTDAALSPEWRGALWAIATVMVIAAIGWTTSNMAETRREGAPMTGRQDLSDGSAPRGGAQAADTAEAELRARLKEDPSDIDALNRLTILALTRQDSAMAMEMNDRALEVAPSDPDARTQRAAIRASMNMTADALQLLDEVIAQHPTHTTSWVYKGLIALQSGQFEIAVTALERANQLDPGQPFLEARLAEAKANAGGGPVSTAPANASSETLAAGQINLGPGVSGAAAPGRILYVSLRDPAGGPPVAAKRLPLTDFPMAFQITTADVIQMGGPRPIPVTFDVSARIDFDGDPMSRDPAEPQAKMPSVSKGRSDLELSLTIGAQ